MRALISIAFCAALLSGGAAFASPAPCDLATLDEVEALLGRAVVDIPVSEIGEETAPYCRWASAGREAEVKLSIWSPDELSVLGLANAESYFARLASEFAAQGPLNWLEGLGERAFQAEFASTETLRANGAIVVLSAERVIVFEFTHVLARDARAFAARAARRL